MMHPSCLMRVEEYIKDKDEEVQKVIRNLCVTSSTNLRIPDLKKTCKSFTDKAPARCRIALLVFDNFRTYPDGDDNYGLSFLNSQHYCPVKILDLEINRVDHHPLGR